MRIRSEHAAFDQSTDFLEAAKSCKSRPAARSTTPGACSVGRSEPENNSSFEKHALGPVWRWSGTQTLALAWTAGMLLSTSTGCSKIVNFVERAVGLSGNAVPEAPQIEAANQVVPSRVDEDSSLAIWNAVSETEGDETPLLHETEHTRFGGWNLLRHGYFGADPEVARSTGRIADTFAFSELRPTEFDDMVANPSRTEATYKGRTVGALVTVEDDVEWFGADAALEFHWDPASTDQSSVDLVLSQFSSADGDIAWGRGGSARAVTMLSFPNVPITLQDGIVGFSSAGTDSSTRISVRGGLTSTIMPNSGNWVTGKFVGQHTSGMPSAGIGRWSLIGDRKLFFVKSHSIVEGRFLVGSFGTDFHDVEQP